KAHAAYIRNRKNSHRKRKLDDELLRLEIINDIQEKHWSPEQIAGRLSVDVGYKVISYNTIYRSIYRDNLMIKKNHGARGIARQLRHRGFFEHRGKLPIPHTIQQDVMNVIEHIFCELQVMKLKRLPLIVEKNSVQTNGFQMNLTLHFIFLIRMSHGNEEQMKIQMA